MCGWVREEWKVWVREEWEVWGEKLGSGEQEDAENLCVG